MNDGDAGQAGPLFRLRLFVAGNTIRSRCAIENLRAFCATELDDRFALEVVDIHQQPALAALNQVVAVPTLLKLAPLPERRIVGDLSQADRLRRGLGLAASGDGSPT